MTFGDKVKQARESLGWTQRRLAEESALSLQLIEHLEARGELMLEIPQTLTLIERAFKRFKVSITGDD
jgi:transcriptional regulator with XRE-family HTH domain